MHTRLVLGSALLVSLAAGSLVWAQPPASPSALTETIVEAATGEALSIPPSYGRLVSVVVSSSEVHHLYFQDERGTIRVVLIGPRGALPRARQALQLLSTSVFTLERKPPQ